MGAGAAYRRHDQVPRFQAADGRTNFHYLGERFMTNHQVVIPSWWRAIFKGADFSVRATDTDVEHAQHDLIRLGEPGSFVLDDFDFFRSRKNCDCLHAISLRSTHISRSNLGHRRMPGVRASLLTIRPTPCILLRSV